MKTTIVLAMHGAPPNDFPRRELAEFFDLHARMEHAAGPGDPALESRYAELDARMRAWPRTPENDPFHAGAQEMAAYLSKVAGYEVIVGYNEFCAPALDDALEQAAAQAEQIIVITPMMTRGGEHSERDIPVAIQRAQGRHPDVEFRYVWPFATAEVAGFLAAQIRQFISEA